MKDYTKAWTFGALCLITPAIIAWTTGSTAKWALSIVFIVCVISAIQEYRKAEKYKTSPAMYDREKGAYYVNVGLRKNMTLLYTCWGLTEKEAMQAAIRLIKWLNA
jgi:hypothetical protein